MVFIVCRVKFAPMVDASQDAVLMATAVTTKFAPIRNVSIRVLLELRPVVLMLYVELLTIARSAFAQMDSVGNPLNHANLMNVNEMRIAKAIRHVDRIELARIPAWKLLLVALMLSAVLLTEENNACVLWD